MKGLQRRSVHQTQWAAQFAVASELCKRGHEVALTMGNHPSVDLMVFSPSGIQFGVDVKGLYTRNFWTVKSKPLRDNLYYVLAFVPTAAANRYFILSQAEADEEIVADTEYRRQRAENEGRIAGEGWTGLAFATAEKYHDAWDKLPA